MDLLRVPPLYCDNLAFVIRSESKWPLGKTSTVNNKVCEMHSGPLVAVKLDTFCL